MNSNRRLIRIERVRYDILAGAYHGTAVWRGEGGLARSPVRAEGAPDWTHGAALRALRAAA